MWLLFVWKFKRKRIQNKSPHSWRTQNLHPQGDFNNFRRRTPETKQRFPRLYWVHSVRRATFSASLLHLWFVIRLSKGCYHCKSLSRYLYRLLSFPRRGVRRYSSGASGWRSLVKQEKHTLYSLTLILLTWRIWWAPNNASRWQMGFNLVFKGLSKWSRWSWKIFSSNKFLTSVSKIEIPAKSKELNFYCHLASAPYAIQLVLLMGSWSMAFLFFSDKCCINDELQ